MSVVNKQAFNYRLLGKHDSKLLPAAIKTEDSLTSAKFWQIKFGELKTIDWEQ